jgi:putative CocE/NonD family hydrolase
VGDLSGRYGGVLAGDMTCAANQAQHNDLDIANTLAQMNAYTTDGPFWRSLSLYPLMKKIVAPVHLTQGWQDDATGPRGVVHLWQLIDNAPKRLLMMNDDHHSGGYRPLPRERDDDQLRWFDYWLGRGARSDAQQFGTLAQRRSTVETIYEMQAVDSTDYELRSTGERQETDSWPIPSTQWTDLYLHGGGGLTLRPPLHGEVPESYVSGSQRYFDGEQHDLIKLGLGPAGGVDQEGLMTPPVDGPDVVSYRTAPFARTGLINGPLVLSLWATSSARDTDFYTLLADEAPNGDRTYLQYGMLRASYRATIPALSDAFTDRSGRRVVYRPYHPYTATSARPLTPGVPYKVDVEIYPVGDIVRPGHRLLLQVTTPPAFTNSYGYQANPAGPGTNQILNDPTHPSHLTVPFIALDGMHVVSTAPPCGALVVAGVICLRGASAAYDPASGPQFDPPQGYTSARTADHRP